MRFFHPAAGVVVALGLASSAYAQSPIFTPEQRAEGEAQVRKAAEIIASTSRDPSSVTFRNVVVQKRVTKDGREPITVCGEVNGRNGYGGFTGFQAFVLLGDNVEVGDSMGLPVSFLCKNNDPITDTRDYTPVMREAFATATGG
jgi:hypothetical protein